MLGKRSSHLMNMTTNPFAVDELMVEEKHNPLLLPASGANLGQISAVNQFGTPIDQTRPLYKTTTTTPTDCTADSEYANQ